MSEERTREDKVKVVIEEIRPYIQADGGDIEFVELNGNVCNVRLKGACQGCPGAAMTLKMGVEQRIREDVPDITVVPVP